MAAPGGSREETFCERCFAPLAAGDEICGDCGAPTAQALPGADSPVHRELAGANLLRLRGDLDGSEKALLGVLRHYPRDPLAHQMLGEVCAEKGELDRAVEWFELALDLQPDSVEAKRRLEQSRERLVARDDADTAETLGLPSAKPPLAWAPLAGAGALVLVAAAIAFWPRSAPPRPVQATVVAPAVTTPAPETTPSPTPTATVPTPPPSATGTEEERKLLEALRSQLGPVRVQSALLDPRTGMLAVAFEVGTTDDPKAIALAVGKAALGVAPTAMTASLHALRADRLVFAADLPRASMTSPDPLTNLWPANEGTPAPATTTGGAPSTPGTTGGATPPGTVPPAATTGGETATSPPAATTGGTTTGGGASPPATPGNGSPRTGP